MSLLEIISVEGLDKMDVRFLVFFLCLFSKSLQDCVWYGECNEKDSKIQNCLSEDKKPHDVNSRSIEIFQQKCPLFLEKVKDQKFCCNDDQVITMERNMEYAAGVFQRCPTCVANLFQHICQLSCSPNQTDFMEVAELKENGSITGEPYVTKIIVHISKEYKESTFDSCKEVTSPSSGEKAINQACGVWGAADQCTSERWFEFFGNFDENVVASFWINYSPPPNPQYKGLHIDTLPCNESYKGLQPCSCSDCEASCTIPFEHAAPADPFMVGDLDGVVFVMLIIVVVLCTVSAVLLYRHHKKDETQQIDVEPTEKPKIIKVGNKMKESLTKFFTVWGTGCAKHPAVVFGIASWLIAGLGYGVYNLRITTDPTEIWASPVCKSRLDKAYFDTRFTPFYRTNQIFIKSKGLEFFNWTNADNFTYTFGPVFNPEFLYKVYQLQMEIQQLKTKDGKGLEKICFAPMKNEFFNEDSTKYCAIQSVWGYLDNNPTILNNSYRLYDTLQKCLRNNFDPNCLAPYGGPIFSPLAVGGSEVEESDDPSKHKHLMATGITLTFLVNNDLDQKNLEPALAWEEKFVEFLKNWTENTKPEYMEVAYAAERSIQDEIERESKAEMTTVIISYFFMFIYITISLGKIRSCSTFLLDTKFTLGIGGIVIVLASVVASLGVFGYLGVSTTLLTIEVIPFLVLAVGVDNIFILVYTYQQLAETSDKSTEELIGNALGKVGPSILLTSASEAACFFIGTLSNMPAIKTFAEYSALAIILNFLFQITCFVSLLAVDSKRQKNNYADIFCCMKVKKTETPSVNPNLLFLLFKNHIGPFLMKPFVRASIIIIFIVWLCSSIACLPQIEKGLDQELSMPDDSHMIDYFQYMKDLLSLGPPVYFVVKSGFNYSNPVEVNAICGTVGCDSDSLVTYLTRASKLSNISYIAKSPSSWIDDYIDWLSNPKCCKQFRENGSFCPHQNPDCERCDVEVKDWRPEKKDFDKFLPYFLNDNPDMSCPKAGHASYAGGVNFVMDGSGQLQVTDNYFMAYHTPLKTSKDYYSALENSRKIADHLSSALTRKLNKTVEVIPHSIFYVYYEQYLTIARDALVSLTYSLLAVFAVTFLFTGFDFKSSVLVLAVVASMLVNMTAMLYWWNITLNAISLVNLIVAVGIGVEFCSHIMHAFVSCSEPDKISKAMYSISMMGSSVFSGITLTKFLGIIVLAFAQTLMLRTFYFRMYLGIVVMGAAHGLILMPVLLSYFG